MISAIWVAGKISALLLVAGFSFAWLLRPAEANWIRNKLLRIMIGLYLAGMFLPNVWLFYIVIFSVVPLASRTRGEAASIYIVTMLSVPTVSMELGVGSIYVLRLDKWLFGAFGLLTAIMTKPVRGAKPKGWFDVPFWMIMPLEILQARGLNFTSMLRLELNVALSFILPYYGVSRSLRTEEDVRRLFTAIAFGAFMLSAVAIYESRFTFLPYEQITAHMGLSGGISGYSKQRAGGLRASTTFVESTSFGIFLAMAFLSTLSIRGIFRAKRFWVTAMLAIIVGIYMANARSAILSLGLGVLAYDIYRRRYQSLLVKMGGLGIVVAVALLIAQFSSRFADRIGLSGSSASTVDYRELLFKRGMEQIRQHPLLGVNSAQTYLELADLKQGEQIVDFVNGYIYYGMTTGVFGMMSLALSFVVSAIRAFINRRRLREHVGLVAINAVIFAIAILTMVTTYTSGFGGRNGAIYYMFLAVGSSLCAMRLTNIGSRSAGEEAATARPRSSASPIVGQRA